jgi:hypothetical protein
LRSTPGFTHGGHPFRRSARIKVEVFLQRFQSLQRAGRGVVQSRCRENGEQAGRFFRQGFRAFGGNMAVVNFNFNGQIAHGRKLRFPPAARKRRFFRKRRQKLVSSVANNQIVLECLRSFAVAVAADEKVFRQRVDRFRADAVETDAELKYLVESQASQG